jgi:hypothetical protein
VIGKQNAFAMEAMMAQDFCKDDPSRAEASAPHDGAAPSYDLDAMLSAITAENLQRALDFVAAPPRGKEIC